MDIRRVDDIYFRIDDDGERGYYVDPTGSCGYTSKGRGPFPDKYKVDDVEGYIRALEAVANGLYHDKNVYEDAYTDELAVKAQRTLNTVELVRELNRQDGAIKDIADAWTVEGPAPRYHHMMQRKLEREWPTLAVAVKSLIKLYRKR